MIHLLTDPAAFDGAEITVAGDRYRHLFRARRVEVGERLRVVDGAGRARWGVVARVDRTTAAVRLGDPAPSGEPAVRVELLVATLKPERAAWLVEKATEVGAAGIHFVHTARAPRTFGPGTVERLRRVAAAAVEQCGRSRLPAITGTHEWRELDALTTGIDARWVLDVGPLTPEGVGVQAVFVGADPRVRPQPSSRPQLSARPPGQTRGSAPTAPAQQCPPGVSLASSAALLVGPEGGWDDLEREQLRTAGWRAWSLGERVLRTETAAVVGTAFLLAS
jgi:16S rRNA (uracil1498-N3)-methyltransferase